VRAAFRQPGFLGVYLGLSASMFGDSLMLLVMSIWVKDLTGSSGAAGLTFFWLAIPSLISPVFGWVIDRFRRRPFLVFGNLVSALMLAPLLLVSGRADVGIIYLVAFLYGISLSAIPAALNGLLKELLPDAVLVDANASLSTTKEGFRLVGPLVGAALYATVGGPFVAVLDAATFVLAAALLGSLRVTERAPEMHRDRWWPETTAGVRHLRRSRVLLGCTIAIGIALLVIGFTESSIYSLLDAFGRPPAFVGVIVSVQGVGAIAGGLTSGRVVRRWGEPGAIVVGLALMAAAGAGIAVAGSLWLVFASIVLFGVALPWVIVAYSTLIQRQTPHRLMGRVSSAADVVLTTPQAMSIAGGAALVSLVDYRVVFALIGAGCALGAMYLAGTIGFGQIPPFDDEPAIEAPEPGVPGVASLSAVAPPEVEPGE
jgi:MFS family permease